MNNLGQIFNSQDNEEFTDIQLILIAAIFQQDRSKKQLLPFFWRHPVEYNMYTLVEYNLYTFVECNICTLVQYDISTLVEYNTLVQYNICTQVEYNI